MGPQFLCFGCTRSGTTFLHERMREHPEVWLPPQKELHYFTHQREHGWLSRKNLRSVREAPQFLRAALQGKRGPLRELSWQLRFYLGPRSDAWYLSLFDAEPGLATGAIEPTYAKLPPEMVRLVGRLMPDLKLIYMMRDPIERSWSSVTKSTAKNLGRPMSETTESEILHKLERSTIYMSSYIEHIERWESVFPKERFFFGFLEDIESDPASFFDRLCAHLGRGPFPGGSNETRLNRAVNHTHGYKTAIPEGIERTLSERLIAPTTRLANRFGGRTEQWVARMESALSRA
jgi:hypothetical protein